MDKNHQLKPSNRKESIYLYSDLENDIEISKYNDVKGRVMYSKAPATPFIKFYFLMMGLSSVMPFVFNYATIDIGEKQYKGYYYSFFSMMSCNLGIVTVIPFIKMLQFTSLNFQIYLGISGVMTGVFFMYWILSLTSYSMSTFTALNVVLVVVCTFKYFYQSASIRVATFYDDSCVAYFYTGIPAGNLVSCFLRILSAYYNMSDQSFLGFYLVLVILIVSLSVLLQVYLSSTDHFKNCEEKSIYHQEKINLEDLIKTYKTIPFEVWISFITNLLHGTFFPAPVYSIIPRNMSMVYWCNIVTIVGAIGDSFGRYFGDVLSLNWVVRLFYWYPVLVGGVVSYMFVKDDKDLNEKYWVYLIIMLLILSFRTGLSITYFGSKINTIGDQNASILLNYTIGAGYFLSGFTSFIIIAFK